MNTLQQKKELLQSSKQFLEYLNSQNFYPEYYKQILELNQEANTSLSRLIKCNNQFLLSTKVDYNEIIANGICGAYGCVKEEGIYIPKSLEADKYFFEGCFPVELYNRCYYKYPLLKPGACDYDVVISKGLSKDDNFDLIINSNVDLFLGDILDLTDENYESKRKELVCKLYRLRSDSYNIIINTERDSKKGKEYILLSKIKKY